jgi:hypothetical protein
MLHKNIIDVRAYILFCLLSILCKYLYVFNFGLYEDDWFYFPAAFSAPPLVEEVISDFLTFNIGRPLQVGMMHVAQLLIYLTQSLVATYLIGGLLYVFGIYLICKLFCTRFGVVGAVTICSFSLLSPLLSVTQFLNGVYGFSLALILVAIAINCYIKGSTYRLFSYAFAFLTLCTYELYFLLFLLAPFYKIQFSEVYNSRKLRLDAIVHLVFFLSTFVIYYLIRDYFDQRTISTVENSSLGFDLIYKVLKQNFSTFSNSFGVYIFTWKKIISHNLYVYIGILFSVIFYCLLFIFKYDLKNLTIFRGREWFDNLLFGLVLLFISYAFSFFVAGDNPTSPAFTSRESRISVAAIFGWSILVFQVFYIVRGLLLAPLINNNYGKSAINLFVCVLFFSPLITYSLVIQKEYSQVWELRKDLLKQIILLTPDATNHTAIVMVTHGHQYLNPPMAIGQQPHDWGFLIENLFTWKNKNSKTGASSENDVLNTDKPFIAIVHCDDWREKIYIVNNTNHLKCIGYPDFPVDLNNLIELEWVGDKVIRVNSFDKLNRSEGTDKFWSNATPSKNMIKIMPDVASWFISHGK